VILPSVEGAEREILDDVREKTGLSFKRLGGINTQEKKVASAVLPILADWIPKLTDLRYLRACYLCFITPYAHPFLDLIIDRWQSEEDGLTSSILGQALAAALDCNDAVRIWELFRQHKSSQCYYQILSKLAACPAVQDSVRNELVGALGSKELRASDLAEIAKVPDPRIRRWFANNTSNSDPAIRGLARRIVAVRSLPPGVEYSTNAPGDAIELFSTECDIANFQASIATVAERFHLKIPRPIRSGSFLAGIELKRWLASDFQDENGYRLSLWFRLEDVDTVTVVLERKPAGIRA
jgi:hypothetical protein